MPSVDVLRIVLRLLLSAVYAVAGVAHLAAPDRFLPIVPEWVPYPRQTVLLTGACEIAGAVGLLTEDWRRLAGWMLALYAICVFPANVKHAVETVHLPPIPDNWWYHGPRLAFQPVFVWWALFAGGVIGWPFLRSRPGREQALATSWAKPAAK
jgi:uncharacterized membrane protein